MPPEKAFLTKSGVWLRNIYELNNSLEYLDEETFNHHVNESKNDFVSWIRDVIKDKELAKEVAYSHSRVELRSIISRRIRELEEIIVKEELKEEHKEEKKEQGSKEEKTGKAEDKATNEKNAKEIRKEVKKVKGVKGSEEKEYSLSERNPGFIRSLLFSRTGLVVMFLLGMIVGLLIGRYL